MADNIISIGVKVEARQAQANLEQLRGSLDQLTEAINTAVTKLGAQFAAAASEIASSMQMALKSVQDTTSGISKGTAEAGKNSHDMAEAVGGALSKIPYLGAAESVIKLGDAIKDQTNATKDEIIGYEKAAQASGTSVEKYVEIKDSLEALQLPTERLPEHLGTLADSIQQAAGHSGAARTAFEQLGISTESWKNRIPPTDEVLLLMADHIKNSKNPQQALAAATKLLGDRTGELIPYLMQGTSAVRAQMEAHQDNAKAVADSTDSASKLQAEETALSEELQTALLPAFRLLVTAVQGVHIEFIWLKAISTTVAAHIVEEVAKVVDEFKGLAAIIKDIFTKNFSAVAGDAKAMSTAVQADSAMAAATVTEVWRDADKEIAAVLADPPKVAGKANNGLQNMARTSAGRITAIMQQANQSRLSDTKATNQQIETDFSDYYRQVEKNGQDAVNKASAQNKKFLADFRAMMEQKMASVAEQDKSEIQLEEQSVQQQAILGKISKQQEIARLAELKQQEIQVEINYLKDREKLYQGDAKKIEEIEARIAKLKAQYALIGAKAETDALKATKQQFDKVFSSMTSELTSFTSGLINGSQSMSQAWTKMADDMVNKFVEGLERQLMAFIERKLMELTIHVQTEAAKDAASQVSHAKEGVRTAYSAAKHAYDATSDIPVVGPVLAPIAAATAFAAVAALGSAEGGQYYVPGPQLTMLHPQEMVLPAAIASRMRNVIDNGGGLGQGERGITVVVNHSVNAVDADSFQGMIKKHSNMIGNEVAAILRKKGFATR